MDSKEFKELFFDTGKKYGLNKKFAGLFIESTECIFVTYLQKSSYGNYYQMIIKIYVQGMFGRTYVSNKELVKTDIGDVQTGEPKEYRRIFDFDVFLDDAERIEKLNRLFEEFILPFAKRSLTKQGLRQLAKNGDISLLPAVEKELAVL
ncbi:DUF4304 domain-containing protein [Pedobacter sp. MC2016-14]|uniref:DUF4304 domain-containing protein n=1 Tax=Pedobacter sp. MC2016-14 TaxID=2897327 RepID=UPI001E2F83CA|nr:DUF4304 domain-containing protein [Pedobacter sp. MC2016-14]MCD0488055.1 DUF4304 domain-containing protein [Pedobacter sp. MC2016-14]